MSGKINNLLSCKILIEGFDDPDISVGIILGTDNSEIKAFQKRGRVIPKNRSKNEEIFYISKLCFPLNKKNTLITNFIIEGRTLDYLIITIFFFF